MNGVQPSVGSRNASSSALSLPLLIAVAPASAAWLAALNCAVWPVAVSRYFVVTLSLWSWSIMLKLRASGRPSRPLRGRAGRRDDQLARGLGPLRGLEELVPLQNDTWPKIEPSRPLTQRPWASACAVAPTWVRLVPLKPKSMVTMAPAGSVGTAGAAAGVVPWVITSGSYTDSAPVAGLRIVAWTNAPRLPKLAMVQPDAAGVIPPVPVSCYGVDRPVALSGLAGTMMSQYTLAAAAGAVAVAVGAAVAAVVPVPWGRSSARPTLSPRWSPRWSPERSPWSWPW